MKSCIKFCGDHQHINQNIHPSPSKWKIIKDNHSLKAKPLTAFVYSISNGAKSMSIYFLYYLIADWFRKYYIIPVLHVCKRPLPPLLRLSNPFLINPSTGFESLQLTILLRVLSYEVKDSAKLGNRSKYEYLWK